MGIAKSEAKEIRVLIRRDSMGGVFSEVVETPPVAKICQLCLEKSGMTYAL